MRLALKGYSVRDIEVKTGVSFASAARILREVASLQEMMKKAKK